MNCTFGTLHRTTCSGTVANNDNNDWIQLKRVDTHPEGRFDGSVDKLPLAMSWATRAVLSCDAQRWGPLRTTVVAFEPNLTVDGRGCVLDGSGRRAVLTTMAKNLSLRNLTFRGGQGTDGGGVDAPSGTSVHLSECSFRTNTATRRGGALHVAGGNATLDLCVFVENRAEVDQHAFAVDACEDRRRSLSQQAASPPLIAAIAAVA